MMLHSPEIPFRSIVESQFECQRAAKGLAWPLGGLIVLTALARTQQWQSAPTMATLLLINLVAEGFAMKRFSDRSEALSGKGGRVPTIRGGLVCARVMASLILGGAFAGMTLAQVLLLQSDKTPVMRTLGVAGLAVVMLLDLVVTMRLVQRPRRSHLLLQINPQHVPVANTLRRALIPEEGGALDVRFANRSLLV